MNIFQPQDPRGQGGERTERRRPPVAERPEANDEDELDLRGLLLTLWRGKWIIAVCMILAVAAGWLVASQMRPTYTATASVLFTSGDSRVIDLGEGVTAQDIGRRDSLQNEIETLNSTLIARRVVNDLSLDRDPEFNPELKREPTLGESVRGWIGGAVSSGRDLLADIGAVSPPPPPEPADPEVARDRLNRKIIANVEAAVSLRPVPDSRVIRISATTDDANTAARIVNSLVDAYITEDLEARVASTREAAEWLSKRVEELRARVQEAEAAVEEMRNRIARETGQGTDVTRQQLQELNAALSRARTERSAAEAKVRSIREELENGGDLMEIPAVQASEEIQTLKRREERLLDQMDGLSEGVPADHPARRELDAWLSELRAEIQEEAQRIAAEFENRADSARADEAALLEEVRMLEATSREQSQSDVRLRQLEREAQAARLLYENFLGRLNETSEQAKLEESNARVLSPAEPPLSADAASGRRILALSGIAGALAGVGLVFLLERLNNTFRGAPQVEQMTGLRVIGSLPAIGRRIRRQKVVRRLQEKPNSALAEAVRNLRTSVFLANIDEPPRTVMITSSIPREGKSTTSMLLALTSQQMGKSAIIVDCDLRMPSLTALFEKREGEAGLVSLLEGQTTLEDSVLVEESTGLHALMARSADAKLANAADILSSQRFRDLITELQASYDLVILDTPPALVVTDARIISSLADAVIYAVKWDSTPRGAVLEGLKELRSVGAPLTGIALTMVDEAKAAQYAYEGYGYYRGRYRGYYAE
ncbi:MAG: GumC family protein [Pseudomonadota bacterium]